MLVCWCGTAWFQRCNIAKHQRWRGLWRHLALKSSPNGVLRSFVLGKLVLRFLLVSDPSFLFLSPVTVLKKMDDCFRRLCND